jgi:hypothetical protein
MSDKIRVWDVYETIHPDNGLRSVIDSLQNAEAAEASGEWTQLQLDSTGDDEYHSAEWRIVGYRMETDKEYEKRMKDLEQQLSEYKTMVAELSRDNRALKNLIEKSFNANE